ncbi:UvrABC system protein B [uncultured archaeon]|nr:UvrABC system protein B [uncultured archaeon]
MCYWSQNLDDLRNENSTYKSKNPFPHQREAFEALNNTFQIPSKKYNGGLLVLPTGAGKTFTAVNWLCRNIIPKKYKIIWLAQSSYLLNQAFRSFCENANEIPNSKKFLNIRVVSSSPSHCLASSIESTDDVIIITTQTAISNFNADVFDQKGSRIETRFLRFVKSNADSGIFIVLDEAHHAPAYGFRHLWMGLAKIIPNLSVLGLTATPTYSDKRASGWLFKIFDNGVIYSAEQEKLIAQNILAIPKYIEKNTGKELAVDDKLYDRLVVQHKDLSPEIIEELANDAPRNDYIINDYYKNKDQYGKTIIFADTWPQCVYMATKLKDKDIKAECVFSKIDANPGSAEARNRRKSTDNEKIINEFKEGKYQVLANIRMLTEGVDIPDVKTVFLTRQTTSTILMTQMVGRALRGKKAGGGPDKSEANIVMFIDKWKGLIDVFVDPNQGGLEDIYSPSTSAPFKFIPIYLVEQLSKHMEEGTIPILPFLEYIPVGWYQTEIIRNIKDDLNDTKEEMQTFYEFVMVYNKSKNKIEKFIKDKFDQIPEEWSDEKLDEKTMAPKISSWINEYFDSMEDIIGPALENDLIKICRHIAVHGSVPEYHSFEDRERYDLSKLARQFGGQTKPQQIYLLKSEYEKTGNLWKIFYKNFHMFINAFDLESTRIILEEMGKSKNAGDLFHISEDNNKMDIELTEPEKEQIKKRDNYTCLCCFKSGKGNKMEIDHIVPVFQGGRADVENSQTLCRECNFQKGKNAINFRINSSPCISPKELYLYQVKGNESQIQTLIRTINMFYHCQAVSEIKYSLRRNGKNYSTWEVELYQGNNPEFLNSKKSKLIKYIQEDLSCDHVKDVNIVSVQ